MALDVVHFGLLDGSPAVVQGEEALRLELPRVLRICGRAEGARLNPELRPARLGREVGRSGRGRAGVETREIPVPVGVAAALSLLLLLLFYFLTVLRPPVTGLRYPRSVFRTRGQNCQGLQRPLLVTVDDEAARKGGKWQLLFRL